MHMNIRKKMFLALAASLLLVGAGCQVTQTPSESVNADTNVNVAVSQGSIEVVTSGPYDAGDVFYTDAVGVRAKIAESKTLENGKAATSFDSEFYSDATFSPDGQYVLLERTCWEDSCHQVYDTATEAMHALTFSGYYLKWMNDGRIETESKCELPGVPCGVYQSVDADEPWVVQKKGSDLPVQNYIGPNFYDPDVEFSIDYPSTWSEILVSDWPALGYNSSTSDSVACTVTLADGGHGVDRDLVKTETPLYSFGEGSVQKVFSRDGQAEILVAEVYDTIGVSYVFEFTVSNAEDFDTCRADFHEMVSTIEFL